MLKIAIVLGTTHLDHVGAIVAEWVNGPAGGRTDTEFELVDVADLDLPPLDEELPATAGQCADQPTKHWAAKVASFDAFIFVPPEYNHSAPAELKNALDFAYAQWANKAAGLVQATATLRQANRRAGHPAAQLA